MNFGEKGNAPQRTEEDRSRHERGAGKSIVKRTSLKTRLNHACRPIPFTEAAGSIGVGVLKKKGRGFRTPANVANMTGCARHDGPGGRDVIWPSKRKKNQESRGGVLSSGIASEEEDKSAFTNPQPRPADTAGIAVPKRER